MYRYLWLPVLFLLPVAAPAAPAVAEIAGQYRAAGSGMVVAIDRCDGGRLCGRIVALGDLPPTDAANPAPGLQARPLCGLVVMVIDPPEWQKAGMGGSLYEPRNGTDYAISVAAADNGALRVVGYSGRPVLSRTMTRAVAIWERVAPPTAPCGGAAATS